MNIVKVWYHASCSILMYLDLQNDQMQKYIFLNSYTVSSKYPSGTNETTSENTFDIRRLLLYTHSTGKFVCSQTKKVYVIDGDLMRSLVLY